MSAASTLRTRDAYRVHGALAMLAALGIVLSQAGCYSYHVYQIGGAYGRELGNQPVTEWHHRKLTASFWGIRRQDLPIDNCQTAASERFGIEEIKVESNFGYVLVAALTLGIVVPLDASWRCARPPVAGGTFTEDRR